MEQFPYTEEQRAIINASPDKDYRVMAVPGSGKSWVTIEFAGLLIDEHDFDPAEILMATFSVSATKELRERLAMVTSRSRKVDISTLHSLCLRICRDRENGSPYAERKVENWAEWRSVQAVRDYLRGHYNVKPWDADKLSREVVSCYQQSKRWPVGQWVKEHEEIHPVVRCPYVEVFEYIEQCKTEENGIEFDDMPQFALELLNTNNPLRRHWQKKYRYIIVDEFQDTDRCQYSVLMHLGGRAAKMLVVGDLFQSVYRFRSAVPELMGSEILKDRPGIVDMPLTYNFRSGRKIIGAANNILQPTRYYKPQTIVPKPDAEDGYLLMGTMPLIHYHLPRLVSAGCPLHEIAVLNRYNADTLEAEACCIKNDIPYVVYGNYSLYDNGAVNAAIDYLRLVYRQDSISKMNAAFERIINIPLRKIPKKTAQDIISAAKEEKLSAVDYVLEKNGYVASKDYINFALNTFAENVRRLRGYVTTINPTLEMTVVQIRRLFDLDNHFKSDASQYEDPEASLNGVQSLLGNLRTLKELDRFLKKMKTLKGKENDKKNRVQLLTGHKAKGLEFEAVFVHAEKDRFPKKDSNIEEERNLFYVMLTRAKSILYLSGNSQFVEQAVAAQPVDRDIRYDMLWKKVSEEATTTALGELPF